jgi:hypothetical protein
MNNPDYSTTLSTRAGSSARLMNVLREFMIYHQFEVTPLPEGGFEAHRPPRRMCKQHESLIFYVVSRLRVTPMGRELVIDATLGGLRLARGLLIGIFIIAGGAMFLAMSQDPQVANTPVRFIPFIIFGPLVLFAPLVTKDIKRKTIAALERMFRAAVNITELP